jgi:hypothetical protein
MSGPTPRRLLHFVTRRLRFQNYLRDPGDGRRQPQIPARLLLWALLVGQILHQHSFPAVEALVRSAARRNLSLSAPFSDDAWAISPSAWIPARPAKPCSPWSAEPNATRPSRMAAGSVWRSTARAPDGAPILAVRSVVRGAIVLLVFVIWRVDWLTSFWFHVRIPVERPGFLYNVGILRLMWMPPLLFSSRPPRPLLQPS